MYVLCKIKSIREGLHEGRVERIHTILGIKKISSHEESTVEEKTLQKKIDQLSFTIQLLRG